MEHKAGDLWRGPKSVRLVMMVSETEIGFHYWSTANYDSQSGPGAGNRCYTSREAFERWCRNAELMGSARLEARRG